MPEKARILVIEDDPAILAGLLDVFVFHGYDPEGEDDGGRGLEKALSGTYDLLVLDVMLPTTDGLAICGRVRAKKPAQPIVMLTAKGSEDDVVRGFTAGADDYVSKPFSIRELMVRVEAVLRRSGGTVSDDVVEFYGVVFDGRRLVAEGPGGSGELTRREMDIVSHLHRAGDRIVGKRELLEQVWHYPDGTVETRTVDIHIQKLRRKLAGLAGGASLIRTIRGEGYRLEVEK
ncbi:MAG: response regulator transcription factor [Desulfatibacillaceae bacterium]